MSNRQAEKIFRGGTIPTGDYVELGFFPSYFVVRTFFLRTPMSRTQTKNAQEL
jgi:hypothetical protein